MDIYLSNEARTEVIKLPVLPEELPEISYPFTTEVFTTVNGGQVLMIGNQELKTTTISSIFPKNNNYPMLKSDLKMQEAKEIINRWRKKRRPNIVTIINDDGYLFHSDLYFISDFRFQPDTRGDMKYTLDLVQFVRKQVKKK